MWRPIETAPKDGSKFWAKRGDDAIAVFWHEGFQKFIKGYNQMTFPSSHYVDYNPDVVEFTEWRPIPGDDDVVISKSEYERIYPGRFI